MIYFLRIILITVIAVVVYKAVELFNRKFEKNILDDIHKHFQSEGFTVKSITPITKNTKEVPFNVNEWSLSTGMEGKDYYANRFWKVVLLDHEQNEHIKWVNTGHFFLSNLYLIVKNNEDIQA